MTSRTRRSFIAVAGAALSAPVAAAASSSWLPPSGGRSDALATRLVHLEDLNEIRALNQAYLVEHSMSGISPADFGQHDVIEIAEDRQTATARLHVIVHTETALNPDCTLVEMAQAQGEGVLRAALPVVLENTYVRRGGVWEILRTRDSRAMA
jgi:hypothetical protein